MDRTGCIFSYTNMTVREILVAATIMAAVIFIAVFGSQAFLTHVCTDYATGFSHVKWSQITNGMPVGVVRTLVGDPVWDDTHGLWVYSKDKATFSWRYCLFVSNAVVIQRERVFYVD